jgi:hypothetical protein
MNGRATETQSAFAACSCATHVPMLTHFAKESLAQARL